MTSEDLEPSADEIERRRVVAALDAWAPLVASGYEVPAAGQVMLDAAALIRRAQGKVINPTNYSHTSLEKDNTMADQNGVNADGVVGVSLRDYFAGQALSASEVLGWAPDQTATFADRCYVIADAMVAASLRKSGLA